MVVLLNEGRLVADRATLVLPVFEPTFLLSAVRNVPGLFAER